MRLYTLRPEPMNEVADWLADVSRAWQLQLDSFKDYVALHTAQPKEKSVITRVKPCWPEGAA